MDFVEGNAEDRSSVIDGDKTEVMEGLIWGEVEGGGGGECYEDYGCICIIV